MAQLPGGMYLVQQQGDDVVIFHRDTEEEIVRVSVSNNSAMAQAQKTIHLADDLTDEQKAFAHFWCGYFHGQFYARQDFDRALSEAIVINNSLQL